MNSLLELSVNEKTFRVTNRESERREFKINFDNENLCKYAKTMAAFANRDGGIIFFGIKDNPKELLGIEGDKPDELVFANFLNEYFEPEILFELDTKKYHGRTVLYVLVPPSSNKPIVCKKKKTQQYKEKGKQDKELLREGAIYYRYSSASAEIKFSELKNILDERVQKIFHSLVDNITLINKVGYDRVAISNAKELSGNDLTTSVYVTTETAKNINWIRKGRFVESDDDGDKAFYVTREIEIRHGVEIEKPVDPGKTYTLTKSALTNEVSISTNYINAVLWKLGLLDNQKFHVSGKHGKSHWHKFTISTKDKILVEYPKNMPNRGEKIKKAYEEYNQSRKLTIK